MTFRATTSATSVVPRPVRRWFALGAAGVLVHLLVLALDLGPRVLLWSLPVALHLLAAGLCFARWRTGGPGRWAWVLIGTGMASYAAGTTALGVSGTDYPVAVPSLALAGWGAFYLTTFAAMVIGLRARVAGLAISLALDGLMGAVAFAAVMSAALVPSVVGHHGILPADAAAGLAFPAGDLLMVSLALCACAFCGWRGVAGWRTAAAGFALLLVGDVALDVQAATGTYDEWALVWATFPAGLLVVAAVPWVASDAPRATPSDSFGVVAVPVGCFLAALGIQVAGELGDIPELAHRLSLVVMLLAALRAASTHRELGRLREARRFEQGFEDAEIGMAIIGVDSVWLRVNDAICRMLGRRADELVGSSAEAHLHPSDPGESAVARAAFAGADPPRSRTYEMVLADAGGCPVEVLVTTARVPGDDGGPWFFSQAQDMTERNRAQRHSAALAELGRRAIETSDPQALTRSALCGVEDALPCDSCTVAGESAEGPLAASVPLRRREGGPQHLVAVREPSHGAFADADLLFLQGVADVLAGALDRTAAERETRRQASQDPLTGLPNRASLARELDHALALSHDQDRTVALVLLDLDRFKVVNDTLGHGAGDELLRLVARRLLRVSDAMDVVARLGGDEFVVVCPLVDGVRDAVALAQRLVDAFDTPFVLDEREFFVAASAGVAVAGGNDVTAESLVRDADIAMYRAKDDGGGRCVLFDGALREGVVRRLTLEHALRRAAERDELILNYQPIVDLVSGRLAGFEALVRWQHPEHGLVPPGDFIPVAEDTGLIRPIGAWVLHTALTDLAGWNAGRAAADRLRISVNVSPRQLTPELPGVVADALRRAGVPAAELVLEITESELVGNGEQLAIVDALRAIGISVALDDFGTGFSSLASVTSIALDVVKLDRSLIAGLGTSESAEALVRAVVEMTGALGLRTVAEGIEDATQLDAARELGCTLGQGWHLARPMDAEAAAELAAAPAMPWDRAPAAV